MNTEEIFKQGSVLISNPKYTGKKKSKEPPYIRTLGIGEEISPGINAAKSFTDNVADSWTMGNTDKYQRYGVTPNRISPNLDKELADNQSNISKAFNALGQSLYSEAFLGTIKAVPDLFDLIGQKVFGLGDDYQNPLGSKIQEWQDYYNNEVAPIYSDPTRNDILNGGLDNFGWWMSNVPSVMSSLTLLIPSTGAVAGLKALAGATKLGAATRWGIRAMSGLNKLEEGAQLTKAQRIGSKLANSLKEGGKGSIFLENAANATLQRAMENYQEAQGVYKDMYTEAMDKLNNMSDSEYQDFINKNPETIKNAGNDDKESVAKYIAKESADRDFVTNFGNVTFDIIQMYGLRGFWKGLKDSHGSYNLNKALRTAKENIGKTPEQIAKAEKDASFWLKAKNNAIDMLKNEKVIIAGELSEGVEEAVNYVAQMEGMNLGRTLLNDDNAITTAWDDRLKRYAKDGGLWDSAFWGVLGGVVFHHAGSGFRRIQATINEKNNKEETNEKTSEGKVNSPFSLAETSEIKARKSNIDSWVQSFNNFLDNAAKIKDGINPYSETETDKKLTSTAEKEIAREKAEEELFTNMTLNAAHNGNLGLLKELVKSDEIRQTLVDKGLAAEDDSRDYQRRMLDRMEKVQNDYETEIEKLYNIANNFTVGKNKDDVVPFEYLQILATDNVRNKYKIDRINSTINSTEALINSALQNEEIRKVFGNNVTYEDIKNAKKDEFLSFALGQLYSQRNEITNDVEHKNDISSLITIDNINKNIKAIGELLSSTSLRKATLISWNAYNEVETKNGKKATTLKTNLSGEAKVLNDILNMNVRDIEGNVVESKNAEQIKKLDEYAAKHGITGKFTDVIEGLTIEETDRQNEAKYKSILSNLAKADEYGISGTTKKLSDLLIDLVSNESNRDYYKNKLVNNKKNLADEISYLNQTMNEGRMKVILESNKVIRDTIKNHAENGDERNSLINSISAAYNKDSEQFDRLISFLDDTEKANFKDAIENLNLSSKLNYRLGLQIQDEYRSIDWLKTKISDEEAKQKQIEEETNKQAEEENKGGIEETPLVGEPENKPKPESKSQEPGKQSAESKQNQPKQKQPINQSQQKPKAEESNKKSFKINLNDSNGGYLALDSNTIGIEIDNADYQVEHNPDFSSNDFLFYPISDKGKTNDEFMDGTEKVLNPEAIIVRPARVKIDNDGNYSIIEKGEIGQVDDNKPDEVQSSKAATEVYNNAVAEKKRRKKEKEAANSSTGGIQQGNQTPIVPATPEPATPTTPEPINSPATTPTTPEPQTQPAPNQNKPKSLSVDSEAEIRNKTMTVYNKTGTITKEDVDNIKNDYINKGYDEDSIKKLINGVITVINKRKKTNIPKVDEFESSITELYFATNDTIFYANDKEKAKISTNKFVAAADNFLTKYVAATNLPQLNGVSYGTYEDLLRYVNELFPDSDVSEFIYNSLLAYLKTKTGKSKFVITDETDANTGESLKNANKTIVDRNAEKRLEGVSRSFSLNLRNLGFSTERLAQSQEALSKLKTGDKLSLEQYTRDNGTKVLLVKSEGIVIGYLGIPNIDESTGLYTQVNDGIRYAVDSSEDGANDGDLKQFLKNIINNVDSDFEEFNSIIHDLAFGKDSNNKPKTITDEIIKRLNNNKAFQEFHLNYVEADSANENDLKAINGLVKLWRYCYKVKDYRDSPNIALRNGFYETLSNSIDSFFDKLRHSYNETMSFVEATNYNNISIEADNISKGQIVRSVNFEQSGLGIPEYSANPIKDIINPNEIEDFDLYASNGQTPIGVAGYRVAYGNTKMVVNRENGTKDIVDCFPVSFAGQQYNTLEYGKVVKADVNYGPDYTSLRECIINQLNELCNNVWNDNNKVANPIDLVNFLDKVLNLRNSSMFIGGCRAIYSGNALYLNLSDNSSIAIFTSTRTGQPMVRFNNVNGVTKSYSWAAINTDVKVIKDAIINILNNSKVNLNFSLLKSDVTNDTPLGDNSMFSRNADGKLVIDIPDYNGIPGVHFEYGSFKDFVVKNNLVRVDIGKNAYGSNFNKLDITKEGASPTVSFKVPKVTETDSKPPVEDNTPKPVARDFKQEIQDVINNDDIKSEDKGFEIAKLLYINPNDSENKLNGLKNNIIISRILNHRVIFDETKFANRDKTVNALYDPKDKAIYLGDRFIDVIDNKASKGHDGRNNALRILFHENIHAQLDELRSRDKAKHDRLVKQMQGIYNDFVTAINQDVENINNGNFDAFSNREYLKDLSTDDERKRFIDVIQQFTKFSPDSGKFEEFITESFTNANLMNYFNSVDIKDDTKLTGSRNLWQRLLEFIGNLFDISIRKGSLREKQLKQIGNLFINNDSQTSTEVKTDINNNNIVEEETKVEEVKPEVKDEKLEDVNKDDSDDSKDNDANVTLTGSEKYKNVSDEEYDDLDFSSIVEEEFNTYQSFSSAIKALPQSERANFIDLVNSGEISVSCR